MLKLRRNSLNIRRHFIGTVMREFVLAAPDSQRKSEGLWIINSLFMKKARGQGNAFIGCLLCVRNSVRVQQVLEQCRFVITLMRCPRNWTLANSNYPMAKLVSLYIVSLKVAEPMNTVKCGFTVFHLISMAFLARSVSWPHFADWEKEAQKVSATCLKLQLVNGLTNLYVQFYPPSTIL